MNAPGDEYEWCGLVGCGQDKSAGVGSSYSYNRDDLGYLSDGEVWFFRDNTQVTPRLLRMAA